MKFEKLKIWQMAIDFSTDIYALTKHFPTEERYGLTSQLRRASTSIALNIAEGSGRNTDADFARFISHSIGSALECVSALKICLNLGYIDSRKHSTYYLKAESLCSSLYSFKKYLTKSF